MQMIFLVKTKFNAYFIQSRHRKSIVFGFILSFFIFYYLWASLETDQDDWTNKNQKGSLILSTCLDIHEGTASGNSEYNVFFKKESQHQKYSSFLPYLGNGYVSMLANDKSYVYLKQGRTFGLKVPYKPFFTARLHSQNKKATSLNIRDGTINQYHCYRTRNKHYTVKETFYAHRTIPSLLVQQILINHPSFAYPKLDVQSNNDDLAGQYISNIQLAGSRKAVHVLSRMLSKTHLVLILQSNFTHTGPSVHQSHKASHSMGDARDETVLQTYLTHISYKYLSAGENITLATKALTQTSMQQFTKILETDFRDLTTRHVRAWNKLWSSGFSISRSLAQNSLNGDRINKTFYYLLSSVRHYLLENSTQAHHQFVTQQRTRASLYNTDRCYSGPHTLQSDKLWTDIRSMEEMNNNIKVWIITLEKHGCVHILDAGAEGLLQSMMLSLGGLKFSNKHLEMAIHPQDLHRDLQFRRINYDANTHVNISVRVGDDNRAVLYVSLDRSNGSFYACDAGCLDPPLLLSNKEVSLPVKLTSPVTSILYIAPDLQHVNELKLAIHVQSIHNAPAHQHDLLALHRHGHRWGGLPMIFWFFLGALIIIFHLFLFKLVYNEYCKNQETRLPRYHKNSESNYPRVTMYQRRFA